MFSNTKENYIYYHINGNYYKIPTFNKVVKIIDFARGTFKVDNQWYVSDVFDDGGDAEGQYDYNTDKFKSNFSFDLARFSTTIINDVKPQEVFKELKSWIKTSSGYDLLQDKDSFDIYVKIAHECSNAIPTKVLKNKLFQRFKLPKKDKPDNVYVYYY